MNTWTFSAREFHLQQMMSRMKTKIFDYSAALSNMTTGMVRYGIKLEIDFSNLKMPMETTVRSPCESFRLFQSHENIERKAFFLLFLQNSIATN